jgi:putative ABC transport system substrate-binding protein
VDRRRFLVTSLAGVLAVPLASGAQARGRIPQLCFLTFDPGTAEAPSSRFQAFFQGLRDLGYVHGRTISIDYLVADGRSERFPELAAECVRLKADLIVVSTTPAAHAAKNATRTIPIVMVSLGDPVGTGLVDSLARPGGNLTGTHRNLRVKSVEGDIKDPYRWATVRDDVGLILRPT